MNYKNLNRFLRITIVILFIFFFASCKERNTIELISSVEEAIVNNDLSKAIKESKLLIEKKPDDSQSNLLRGMVFSIEKNYKEGLLYLHKAIRIDSLNYLAYIERAKIKIEMGDYFSAIEDCRKAKMIRKDYAPIYITEGNSYELIGDITNAISKYEYAIKYGESSGLIFYKLGNLHLSNGNISTACEFLSRAGELGYMEAYQLIKSHCSDNNRTTIKDNDLDNSKNIKTIKNANIQITFSSKMEIQTEEYALRTSNKKLPLNTIIIQQAGLNAGLVTGDRYCRVILEVLSPDLTDEDLNLLYNESERIDIDIEYRKYFSENLGAGQKLIHWYPIKVTKWNGLNVMHISYKRQYNNSPYVMVNQYVFVYKGDQYKLILSYRLSEEHIWGEELDKIRKGIKFL